MLSLIASTIPMPPPPLLPPSSPCSSVRVSSLNSSPCAGAFVEGRRPADALRVPLPAVLRFVAAPALVVPFPAAALPRPLAEVFFAFVAFVAVPLAALVLAAVFFPVTFLAVALAAVLVLRAVVFAFAPADFNADFALAAVLRAPVLAFAAERFAVVLVPLFFAVVLVLLFFAVVPFLAAVEPARLDVADALFLPALAVLRAAVDFALVLERLVVFLAEPVFPAADFFALVVFVAFLGFAVEDFRAAAPFLPAADFFVDVADFFVDPAFRLAAPFFPAALFLALVDFFVDLLRVFFSGAVPASVPDVSVANSFSAVMTCTPA